MEDFVDQGLYAAPRFGFLVMTVFGCVGLILVTVGVYSVLAYSTTQKTHEIGIRMALGAKGADVLGMVVRSGLRLVLAGIAVGIGHESRVLRAMIGTQLVGVTAYDPPTLAATTLLLDDDRRHRLLDSRAAGGASRSDGRAALRIADAREMAARRCRQMPARRAAAVFGFGTRVSGRGALSPRELVSRLRSPVAFGRRCIPPGGVAPPSNTPSILGRRALPAGRIAALGA